jgi:beta-mannosidase
MGHGHYVLWDPDNGGEVFQWMPKAKNTAYTEFGIPGVANLEVLKAMMPPGELFPPKLGTTWESHHAFKVWGDTRWLELPFLEDYFGKMKNIEDLVAYSQLSQCEGYKCIFEEARRQKPYCGMAVNWDFQEPWPCAANNSLINYPFSPKPAYYHVGRSLRPVLASARVPKFRWDEGDTFSCDLFLLNDTYDNIPAGKMTVKLVYDDNQELPFYTWDFSGTSESKNIAGPIASVVLPRMKHNLFRLVLQVADKPEYKSEYTFVYRGKEVTNIKPDVNYLNGIF